MKRNIIVLLILSMLAVQFPAIASAANEDAREALNMSMQTHTETDEVVYENNRLTTKGGRAFQAGSQCLWSDISYSSIADGNDWVGVRMRLTNDEYKDFSQIEDNSKIVYKVKLGAAADTNNLYFTVSSKNGAVAAVSADAYINADKNENGTPDVKESLTLIQIPMSEFNENIVSGVSFDASEFNGIGMVRKHDPSGTDPADTGTAVQRRIFFAKMSVVSIPAPADFASEVKSGIKLSFTKPSIATIDKYELVKSDGASEQTLTLTDDDFILASGKYEYTDANVEVDTEYTYKLRMHESEYDMYSPYSTVTGEKTDEDDSTEIPSDNQDTAVFNFQSRGFTWVANPPSVVFTRGGTKEYINQNIPSLGIGSGVTKFDLNPNIFKEKDSYDPEQGHPYNPYRGYMAGGYYIYEKKGADTEDKSGKNINQYADTGYATFYMYIDEAVPLENLYFAVGDSNPDGRHDSSVNFIGVPVTDYITEADRGHGMYVSIPLKDFTLSNPHMFQSIWNDTWANLDSDVPQEINWKRFYYMGFIRRVYDGNNGSGDVKLETPEYNSGYVYTGEYYVTNVNPVKNFRVYDVKSDKVVLKWDHTSSAVEQYNIYRTDGDGQRELLGSTTVNQYSDNNGGNAFPVGVNFKYEIEAVDKYGAKSPVASDETLIRSIDHPRKFKAESLKSATSALEINISWSAPLFGDLEEYVLYRNGEVYQRFDPSVTSFKDTDLVEHSDYEYTMTAVSSDGSASIPTNPVTVTASALGKPENLTYRIMNSNQAEMSYNAPEFAEKYYIYVNGEKVGETSEITYTVTDIPYDTAIILGVRAVNAAGSVSNEVQTAQFVIKNPEMQSALTIFDDRMNENYQKETSGGASITETNEKAILGNKSLCLDFSPRKNSPLAAMFTSKSINLEEYRNNGGRLGFWLYADKDTDLGKIQVGVGSTTKIVSTTVPLRALVNLGDYAQAQGKWTYVEIPLTDIPDNGTGNSNGKTQTVPMDYADIKNIVVLCDTSRDAQGPKVYLDQVTIDTGYSWNVERIEDGSGNTMPISAGADKIKVKFSKDMLPETLTTEGVKLRYEKDGETKYVNYYGTYENKVFTLNLLEPLAQDMRYTLSINGARTTDKKSSSYEEAVFTNSDTPASITYTVPGITPEIETSVNGSAVTVTVKMPKEAKDAVKGYSYKLSYNSTYLTPNGANAVTNTPSGAQVSKETNSITVSGDKEGSILSDTLMQVEFAVKLSGSTKVSVSGSANVYNIAAQAEARAAITAEKTFSVTKKSGTAPESGVTGGNGGGGGTDKSSRDEKTTTPGGSPDVTDFDKPQNSVSFTDIDEVPWAKEAIKTLAEKGFISGYDDGAFKPNNTITREEFAKMLIEVFELTEENYDAPSFKDFNADAWYAKYVTIAVHNGYVNGVSDDMFGTGQMITRQDMCAMLYRAIMSERLDLSYQYDAVIFDDEISDYAAEAVSELQKYGIVDGIGNNLFDPHGNVTRAMAAKVLYIVYSLM